MPQNDASHTMEHVQDSYYFEIPAFLTSGGTGKVPIPQFFGTLKQNSHGGFEPASGFCVSKFMVLEVVAAACVALIFIRVAALMKAGGPPRGRFWNFFEVFLVYIRDQVAEPAIGHHDAKRFLPFLWTIFFFVLGCNLLGMLPWAGSATGAWGATAALAFVTFVTVVGSGMVKVGPLAFWQSLVPHIEINPAMGAIIKPLIFVIELMGLIVKHFVLSVRLLANMFAGHLVLAVILGFIKLTAGDGIWYGVMPVSIFGSVALSMLELFVAFLQAYIFTFLSALFIGMAVHPH